jgi:hypothetical protein
LRSLVFHGPSPLWCLASGQVWFHHPEVGKMRCFSQHTVDALRRMERQSQKAFDWQYFDIHERRCLRLSQYGFEKRNKS